MAFKLNCYLSVFEVWRICTASSNPIQTQSWGSKGSWKNNSPSLWHDELAVCCGNWHYTQKFSFCQFEELSWGWNICMKKGDNDFFVSMFLVLPGRWIPKSFASLGFSSCVCFRSLVRKLSSSEMLKYFLVRSCFCKCHHVLIFLGFFFCEKKNFN